MQLQKEMISITRGTYQRSHNNCIPDDFVVQAIDIYRDNVLRQIRSIYADRIDEIAFREKVYASIKIDGANAYAVYDRHAPPSQKVYLCNTPYHRVWLGLDIHQELEQQLEDSEIQFCIIAGELFAAPVDRGYIDYEGRSFIHEFMPCQVKPTSDEDLQRIGFKIFDLVLWQKKTWNEWNYGNRLAVMRSLFPETGQVSLVRTYYIETANIPSLFDQIVTYGNAEGLIVRHSNRHLIYKIKHKHTIDGVIVGVTSSRIKNIEAIDTLLIALRTSSGKFVVIARVSSGLTDDQRISLWKKMKFIPVTGRVTDKTEKRVPFQLVFPEIIVEISFIEVSDCEDLGFKRKPKCEQTVLEFQENTQKWIVKPSRPFFHLKYSWITSIREDKTISIFDIRSTQVEDIMMTQQVTEF
ncbi:MAG: hypothetical protein ACTSWW_06425 [Promethearchaeota archaeon]